MVQTLHPGVYSIEQPSVPTVVGVSATTGGFVGPAQWGPARLVINSFEQYQKFFGTFYKVSGSHIMAPFAVKAFFENGGQSLYFSRVVPSDAARAWVRIGNHVVMPAFIQPIQPEANAGAIAIGKYDGAVGNNLRVNINKASTNAAESKTFTTGTTVQDIVVDSVNGFEAGDIVRFRSPSSSNIIVNADDSSPALEPTITILYVDAGTNTLYFANDEMMNASGETVDTTTIIETATTHRFKGKTLKIVNSNLLSFDNITHQVSVTKGSATNIVPGQQLSVFGCSTWTSTVGSSIPTGAGYTAQYRVASVVDLAAESIINLNIIGGSSANYGSHDGTGDTLPVGTSIVSMEFDVEVFNGNNFVEKHSFLSTQTANERDYVGEHSDALLSPGIAFSDEGRLVGSVNESAWIELGLDTEHVDTRFGFPLTRGPESLQAGGDGTLPTATEAETVIDSLSGLDDMSMISAPDWAGNISVQGKLADFMDLHRFGDAVLDPSLTDSEGSTAVDDILAWRLAELNKSTSYAAIYWPWAIVRDPLVKSDTSGSAAFDSTGGVPTVKIPMSGHMQGLYARVVFDRGIHKAPANIPLRGIIDLTYKASDVDQDRLNPVGVNAIRSFAGEGIRPYGTRTLHPVADGFHYVPVRRLTTFIRKSIERANRFAVFEPNQPSLWKTIETINANFLQGLWKDGLLAPSNNVADAYFVQCDTTTNSKQDIKAGKLNCKIGFNPPYPAEFVVFTLSLFDGATSVS